MHIVTHLSPKYEALRNSVNGWSEEEAGMAQILDDDIGLSDAEAEGHRRGRQHHRPVHHRQRYRSLSLGRMAVRRPSLNPKERSLRVASTRSIRSLRWPGHVPADLGAERHFLRDGLVCQPSSPPLGTRTSPRNCWRAKKIGDRTYKNHLDGYNQMDATHRNKVHPRVMRSSTSAKHGRRNTHRRLQVPFHRSTTGLVR